MTTATASIRPSSLLDERGISWGWLLALGILMTGLGVFGLGMTYWLTAVAVFWCGVLLLVGGVAQVLDAFHHKGWKGIIWHVIIGLIYIVAGIAMTMTPVSSAFWLTLFLAISLIVTGSFRIVTAFQMRGYGPVWLAVLVSGAMSIVLGILIYNTVRPPGAEALATPAGQLTWLRSWGWIIGLYVAIEMIMEGAALVALAFATRSAKANRKAEGYAAS